MTTNEDDKTRPDLPEPSDDTAEVDVIAHSDEQSEDPPSCYGVHVEH
ncbi:hypothetical protein [Polymorphospora sp. NPDC050346]